MIEGRNISAHDICAREVFAKSVTEKLPPQRNGELHRFVFKDGMFVDTIRGVKPSFGRTGQAYSTRGGRLELADTDFPSYDDHGIRLRGECDQYMWATDHPETFNVSNALSLALSPDEGIGGGNAGRCIADNDAGSWQILRHINHATAFVQGDNWCFSIYAKAATAEDVGKKVRLAMQEFDGVDSSTIFNPDFVLTDEWSRYEMYIPITSAAATRISCVVARSASENQAEVYDICCPMLNKGTKARDFVHNTGDNGSIATRNTEAADGSGNGLSTPASGIDDFLARMGKLVTEEYVDSEELIGNAEATIHPEYWSTDNVFTFPVGAAQWTITNKDILERGKKYCAVGYVSGLTSGERIQIKPGAEGTSLVFAEADGPFSEQFICDGTDGVIQFQIRDEMTTAATVTVSVKEVKTRVLTRTKPQYGPELNPTPNMDRYNADGSPVGWAVRSTPETDDSYVEPYENGVLLHGVVGDATGISLYDIGVEVGKTYREVLILDEGTITTSMYNDLAAGNFSTELEPGTFSREVVAVNDFVTFVSSGIAYIKSYSIREVYADGGELIDNVEEWTATDATRIDLGVDSFQFVGASQYSSIVKTGLLTVGETYIVSGNVSGLSGSFRMKSSGSTGEKFDVTEDGPFCGVITAVEANFAPMPIDATSTSATVTNLSVKKVAPEASVVLRCRPLFDHDDTPTGYVMLTTKDSSVPSNGWLFGSGSNKGAFGSIDREGDYCYSSIIEFSAGDPLCLTLVAKDDFLAVYANGETPALAQDAGPAFDFSADGLKALFGAELPGFSIESIELLGYALEASEVPSV